MYDTTIRELIDAAIALGRAMEKASRLTPKQPPKPSHTGPDNAEIVYTSEHGE